ncbi:MAG TPA: sugar phosphate nucleotidyltransferase [Polyangiaceae bacterium]|jgi:NDP-sugar pyrophosphorylase family protein
MTQAVILAGGLGTRMAAWSSDLPKSLLVVAGRPFIAWQLERIQSCAFTRVVLCVGHRASPIFDFVGDGSRFGLRVEYSDEGEQKLGTLGALRHALGLLDECFLVTYGDSFLPFDYSAPLRDLVQHPQAIGTMSVFLNQGRWDVSNTRVVGDHVERYEKGGGEPGLDYIDYGALALRRSAIEPIQAGVPLGLDSLQAELAGSGSLRALVVTERFYEIGSPEGLRDLELMLTQGDGAAG